ncbi:MAG: glycosyltransferase family 39 protein [Bryobacteraceae bacterium]|nr:glycosyltransferase family 39 protein [Bryobacteraceae bacterium]MDW8379280.1 glycosyltransferase family 39 protein [Bryobacterales bacterium]
MTPRHGLLAAALLVAASRFCHWRVVWVEEAYPLAAGLEMLRGKMLYRDVWFDKPPLSAAFYTLFGGWYGWPLRLAGTILILFTCYCAYLLAREWWGQREARTAAALLAFFLTFGVPSAVLPVAPDLLLIAPHLLAIWFCLRSQPFRAGIACGIAMLVHTKALYVGAACLAWQWRSFRALAGGCLLIQAPFLIWLWGGGALREYWEQVWQWGFRYAADSPYPSPWLEGLRRTLNWLGFHATLAASTACFFLRRQRFNRQAALWLLVSCAAVAAGARFFPRYYFQLLAPLVVLGAWGVSALPSCARTCILALLFIPLARFGPRHVLVGMGKPWNDLLLHDDSRMVAEELKKRSVRSLLVWGYRPEIYAYSRLPAATKFLDSQPLTGVIADRHLWTSRPTFPQLAQNNRLLLLHTAPEAIVDGLGPLNPSLAITNYEDLKPWLAHYVVAYRSARSIVYLRTAASQ